MGKTKIPDNLRYVITLAFICAVMATVLSIVYSLTNPKIMQQKKEAQDRALKEVFSSAEHFEPVKDEGGILYYKAYRTSEMRKLLGYAFKAEGQGYASTIETMAGMDTKGEITGISILFQNETPGLGAKVNEVVVTTTLWQAIKDKFSGKEETEDIAFTPWFCAQFKGKKIRDLLVVKEETTKNIQAITGATISSEALTDSVRKKAEEILSYER